MQANARPITGEKILPRRLIVVVFHIQRSVHRRHVNVLLLEGSNFRLVLQREPDIVKPFQQAVFAEGIDLEGVIQPFVIGHRLLVKVDRQVITLVLLGPLEKLVDLV